MKAVRGCLLSVVRVWRSVALVEVFLLGIVGVIGGLSGWHAVKDYANLLLFAGIITFIAGALSLYSGFESSRSITYITGTLDAGGFSDPRKNDTDYNQSSFSYFALLGSAGLLAVILSVIGRTLAG